MVFHSKFLQVSRTLLSILPDLNNAVVCMVSTHPLISQSSIPFINPLAPVLRPPITIDIIITFMFHNFFNSQARSRYLSFFSLSLNFTLWSAGTAKTTILQVPFFLGGGGLIIIRSGRLSEITWSVCTHTLSVLICCIWLLCDWSFRFYHHIIYICCFVASYLF